MGSSTKASGGERLSVPGGPAEASGAGALEVAAGLVFRGGRLLITQRRPEDHQGGLWEFPGGKRHSEESYEECLRRELREELGMEVRVGRLLAEITHAYPDRTVRLRFFLCTWLRHEPRPIGCSALAWVLREELAGFRFPPADARLLQRLSADRSLWEMGRNEPPAHCGTSR